MRFANPHMLYLLWALPLLLLVFLYGRHKRLRILSRFAETRMLGLLVPPGIALRRRLKATLVLAAVWLLVMAMAGPRYGYEWRDFERRGVDLIVALDCSRSMLAEDIAPTRLARAKRELVDLLSMLEGDRIGLVAFSGSAFLQCPLTLDYSALDLFLNVLTPDYMPLGGTDLAAAVQTAIPAFDPESTADKAIILITDGEHTGRGDPIEAADAARKAGIKLFCIGIGAAEGVPVPAAEGGFAKNRDGRIVLTRLDEPVLIRMALATGGAYVRSVVGDMDLDVIYREGIRGGMAQATLESGRRQVWAERYQWPLLICILLFLAAQALPESKKSILPLLATLAVLVYPAPGDAGPLQKGYKAYHQGHYEEALQQFVEGQLKRPDDPEVLYNIGNSYYKTGDFTSAAAHYVQALSKAPAGLKSQILYNLGNTAYRLGDLQEAIRNYEAALQLAPDDLQAQENLDFVKDRLAEQQQQQQPSRGSQSEQPSDSADASDPDQSQFGDERQPDNRQAQNRGDSDPLDGPDVQPSEGQDAGENDSSPSAGQDQIESESGDREQPSPPGPAVHMLNRLKDQPGRAMVPDYGKQPVDKDW